MNTKYNRRVPAPLPKTGTLNDYNSNSSAITVIPPNIPLSLLELIVIDTEVGTATNLFQYLYDIKKALPINLWQRKQT
jgi:hypothetical protein